MTKPRFPLAEAEAEAQELVVLLTPCCERPPEVAGSMRRQTPDVGDIELVCIPKPLALPFYADNLDFALKQLLAEGRLAYRRNKRGSVIYGPLNKLLIHVASGIPVDIFTSTAENFGRDLMIRTGPKEWNIKVMARFLSLRCKGHAYGPFAMTVPDSPRGWTAPDEATMFRLLGWPYVPPEARL